MATAYLISTDRRAGLLAQAQLAQLLKTLQQTGITPERVDGRHPEPRWVVVSLPEEVAEEISVHYPALIVGPERNLSF